MWGAMYEQETEDALTFRVQAPLPPEPPKPSFGAQAAEFFSSPLKGFSQGINEMGRVAARIATARPEPDPADRRSVSLFEPSSAIEEERARSADRNQEIAQGADEFFRRGVDYWKPDPLATTKASSILHGAARLFTKIAGYTAVAGPGGAAVGTGLDEGVTGYQELRDKGVDPSTAAKVAVVRGVTTGVGIAIPVAGSSIRASIGLAAASGPGSFMAEQALSREILEAARYPEIAAEYDPFDPTGLIVSAVVPGVAGVVAHRLRARANRSGEVSRAESVADDPEVRDAAHVAYRAETVEAPMLGDRTDAAARSTHVQALEDAARAMDEGRPVQVPELAIDPVKAQAVFDEVSAKLRAAAEPESAARMPGVADGMATNLDARAVPVDTPRAAIGAVVGEAPPVVRADTSGTGFAPMQGIENVARQVVDYFQRIGRAEPAPEAPTRPASPEMQRADQIAVERPELVVRLEDDNAAPRAARDVLEEVRAEVERDLQDSKAFEAAVTCYLRFDL